MASAFTHALVGAAIGLLVRPASPPQMDQAVPGDDEMLAALTNRHERYRYRSLPLWMAILAAAPDLDVVMHTFVRYENAWGHRGAFHSIALYLLGAALIALVWRPRRSFVFAAAFLALLSHSLLDMLTDGGLGVGLFWPLSNERFFFPWQPIPVSPLGIQNFFGPWGLRVLRVELSFAVPIFAAALVVARLRTVRKRAERGA